ncbi:MAG: flagellin N-terminal helical domain-containing protein [Schwartzia sp. (in: firmicutes)]
MAMVIKNNMSAKNTLNQLNRNSKALGQSLAKVSSGMRINNAGDDASGYAISERMRGQVLSLGQDDRNTQNGNSMLKVAEGAVQSDIEILRTLKEKAINAANDTNTDEDRKIIQREVDQMIEQIDDNANVTYNGMKLIDGSRNHFVKNPGTRTALVNQSFSEDTTPNTPFTALKDRTGNRLDLDPTDQVTVSYVNQRGVYTQTFPVKDAHGRVLNFNRLSHYVSAGGFTLTSDSQEIGTDAAGNKVYTADNKKALTFTAGQPGLEGQISGLTISVTDRYGKIKQSANTILNNFQEQIRAENPSPDNSIVLHTGTKSNQAVKVGLSDLRCTSLGLKSIGGQRLQVSTRDYANAAINVIETALQKVTNEATNIGAVESRLGMTSGNIVTQQENTQSSESVIRDADMAAEMAEYTKNNVLQQASQSMLAQANQNSSAVLSLLQ